MMEVLEEEELESLRRHQEDFEKRRNTEMLEVQRMESAEKRRSDEMERRMHQAQAQREQDLSVMKKVISRSVAASHLSSLKDRALAHLLDAGVFANSIEGAVENRFVPDLLKQVSSSMSESAMDRRVVGAVMQSCIKNKFDTHRKVLQSERDRLAAIDAAEKQARIEREQERLRIEGERQRILKEQQAMVDWEQSQPATPPVLTIKSAERVATHDSSVETAWRATAVNAEGEEAQYWVAEEKFAELQAMIASLEGMEPPKIVVADLPVDWQGSPLDAGADSSNTYDAHTHESVHSGKRPYLDNFRLADKPEEAPTDEAAAAPEGGEAA